MSKLKLWVFAVGLAVLGAAGLASVNAGAWSSALSGKSDSTVVESDETHEGSLYAAGETVRIEGNVEGDLYCAASTVVIVGNVSGDVLCAAQSITIDGEVRQDVRLLAQTVDLSGEIGGSVSVVAQNVTSSRNLMVEGDVNGLAQSVDLNGTVGGGVVMAAQSLTIGGSVAGNVDANVNLLRLGGNASVAGDLSYKAPSELSLDAESVSGAVNYLGANDKSASGSAGSEMAAALLVVLAMFIATAFVIAALAPRFVERSSRILGDQPLNTILMGFAAVFALPILALFMFMSVVLVPLGMVVLLMWSVVLILSGTFAAYYIGAVLLRSKPNVLIRMLGGVLVLSVLAIIPLLNILVLFAATVVGSGALIATFINGYRRPSYSLEKPKNRK